jgi:hypothetical protein
MQSENIQQVFKKAELSRNVSGIIAEIRWKRKHMIK